MGLNGDILENDFLENNLSTDIKIEYRETNAGKEKRRLSSRGFFVL